MKKLEILLAAGIIILLQPVSLAQIMQPESESHIKRVQDKQRNNRDLTQWIGLTDNWNNPLNWDNGVPDVSTDVLIPNGCSNYPFLTGTLGVDTVDASISYTCASLYISSDASLIVRSGSSDLVCKGEITCYGMISVGDDMILYDGAQVNLDQQSAGIDLGYNFGHIGKLTMFEGSTVNHNSGNFNLEGLNIYDGSQYNGSGGQVSLSSNENNDVFINIDATQSYFNIFYMHGCSAHMDACEADLNIHYLKISSGSFIILNDSVTCDSVDVYSMGHICMFNGIFNINDALTFNMGTMYSIYGGEMSVAGRFLMELDCIFTMEGGTINCFGNLKGSLITFVSLSGGILNLYKDLDFNNDDFEASGGIVNFTGATNSSIHGSPTFYNLIISKSPGHVVTMAPCNSIHVLNNLFINSGMLDTDDKPVHVGGSWTNNVGSAGFNEGSGTVTFYSSINSEINSSETFYNLKLDKPGTGFDILEFAGGVSIDVFNNMLIMDGQVEMDDNSSLNVLNTLYLEQDAGLNASDDSGLNISIGNNWINNNTTFDNAGIGFSPGTSTVTFNGSQNASIEFAGNKESFYNLVIDKASDTLFSPDSLLVSGDIHLVNGIFYGSPTHATLLGDLTCESNGKWDNARLLLTGTDDQSVSLSSICLFGEITIDKQSEAFNPQNNGSRSQSVNLHTDLCIFGDEDLNIENGTLQCDDISLYVSGSVVINDGGTLNLAPGASLKVKEKISVNGGGLLSAIGTGTDPITFTDWSGALLDGVVVRSGGSVTCSYATFEFLNDSAIFIKNGALVDPSNPFSHCSFSNVEPGTTLMTFNNNQSLTLEDIDFGTNPGSGAYNIRKALNQGQISISGCTGAFAGPVFENDPHSRIDWTDLGTWTGVTSNDWLTASNWTYHILPDADQDVTITSGYNFAPAILSKSHSKSLDLQSGTDIYILDTLCIHGNLTVAGSVMIDTGPENVVETDGDITWQAGAQCTAGTNSKIILQGDWIFETGSEVQLINGTACFTSPNSQRIVSYETHSYFNNILSQTPDTLFFSQLTTDSVSCNNLLIDEGSTIVINSTLPVAIRYMLHNYLGHFYANYGELAFTGSEGFIVFQSGDYLNNLRILTDNYVELNADYTDTLVINGDFVIEQGNSRGRAFDPNGSVVILYGDWTNDQGGTGFIETGSTVIFKGTVPSVLLTPETFDNLKLKKTGSPENGLLVGPANGQGVDLNVLSNLFLLDGTMELNDPSELSVGGTIQIANGAGLNADDTDFTINVGGNWINENTSSSPTEGFYHQDQGLVMFNGTVSSFQNVYQLTEFHNIEIYRPEGYYVKPLGAPILAYDIIVISGILRTAGNKVFASNDIVIQDKLEMITGSGDSLIAHGNIFWQVDSEAVTNYGEIQVHGDWGFTVGCDVQLSESCIVRIAGKQVTHFYCMDDNASIGSLIIDKDTTAEARASISITSTDTLRVSGDLTVCAGNEFMINGRQLNVNGNCLIDTLAVMNISLASGQIDIDSALILTGRLDVLNGTAKVHGLLYFEESGQLNIVGGSMVCDVTDYPAVTYLPIFGDLNLDAGLLAVTGKGLHFMDGSTHDISGGTIMTKGSFFARSGSVFQPTGGKVEMIGNDDCNVRLAEGLWFHNLVINKNTGYTVSAMSDINIIGDLSVKKGTFNTNSKNILVGD